MNRTFLSVEIGPDLKATLKERAVIEGGTVSALVCRVLANASKRWNNKTAGAGTPTAASTTAQEAASNGTKHTPSRKRRTPSANG